jgi:chromate reductase, NAD(P)H dehydrogenase (quinone)
MTTTTLTTTSFTSDTRTEGDRRVLAIPGSLRAASFNRALLHAAVEEVPAGMTIDLYNDLATIPLFDEDLEQATGGGPESVQLLRTRAAAADGLLIATPEYNQSLPGVLKNAIDWLSRGATDEKVVLVRKPIAVIGATAGPWGTRFAQSALRHTLYATESLVMPAPTLFVRESEKVFADGRLADARTRTQLRVVLAAFARWMAMADSAGLQLAG